MTGARILVADDDPALRRSLGRVLQLADYEVVMAETGAAALEALAVQQFSIVVLDVAMPPPDGLRVCASMRARGDRTPVLMLTARTTVPDRVEGLEAGADDYLVKPFAVEELLARVRALLRRAGGDEPGPRAYADLVLDPRREDFHEPHDAEEGVAPEVPDAPLARSRNVPPVNNPADLTHDSPSEEQGAELIAGGSVIAFGRNQDGVSLFVNVGDRTVEVSMHAPEGVDIDYIDPGPPGA